MSNRRKELAWNDCVAFIEVAAKRSRNILQHESVCEELINMFLTQFNYRPQSEKATEITKVLTTFYMEVVERNKIIWLGAGKARELVMTRLGRILHA